MMTIDTATDMILTEYRNRMNAADLQNIRYGFKIEYAEEYLACDVIKLRDITLLKEDEFHDIITTGIKIAQNRFLLKHDTIRVVSRLSFKEKKIVMTLCDVSAKNTQRTLPPTEA